MVYLLVIKSVAIADIPQLPYNKMELDFKNLYKVKLSTRN